MNCSEGRVSILFFLPQCSPNFSAFASMNFSVSYEIPTDLSDAVWELFTSTHIYFCCLL